MISRLSRTHVLLAAAFLLALLDAALRLSFPGRHLPASSLLRLFDATAEKGVPTWFSVVVMASVARACVSRTAAAARLWPWAPAAAFFGFLSLDDACELHERVGAAVAPHLGTSSVYPWTPVLVPLFAVAGVVFAAAMVRALAREPGRCRCLLSGFAAMAAAVGIEVAEAGVDASGNTLRGIPWVAYTQCLEELLEMLGPIALLAAISPATASGVNLAVVRSDSIGTARSAG